MVVVRCISLRRAMKKGISNGLDQMASQQSDASSKQRQLASSLMSSRYSFPNNWHRTSWLRIISANYLGLIASSSSNGPCPCPFIMLITFPFVTVTSPSVHLKMELGINFTNIAMQGSKPDNLQLAGGIVFILSAAAYMAGPWVSASWLVYFKVVPLVVVVLLILKGPRRENTWTVAVGLIFGIMGDLVLQHGGEDLFAAGAGLFLINHIFYNVYFLALWRNRDGEGLFHRRAIALLAFILFVSASSINLLTSFSDKTKQDNGILVFLLPVYIVVLDMTALNPLFLLLSERKILPAAIYMLVGGISYFFSDNLLGMSKFGGVLLLDSRRVNSLAIMVTYYIAQYFIPLSLKQRDEWVQKDDLERSLLTEQHHQ